MAILKSKFNSGDDPKDRLWSGDHLFTENVNTEVRFWPECNISYTEKTITVTNDNINKPWVRQEEAIYDAIDPLLQKMGIRESFGWNINLLILFGPIIACVLTFFPVPEN